MKEGKLSQLGLGQVPGLHPSPTDTTERGAGERRVTMMRAAIYVRTHPGENLAPSDKQVAAAQQWIGARGYAHVRTYLDEASGWHVNRPGLQRVLADARWGDFDLVVALEYDCLSRSLEQLIGLMNELEGYGVHVVSTQGLPVPENWNL